jgi:putative ABC transport system permease protein
MSWIDNVRIAIAGATTNKLRSLLTILGVLIGVGAVIILVAVGTGSSAQVQANIDRLGTNTLTVFGTGRFGGRSTTGTQSSFATMTLADVQQIEQQPGVQSVSPVSSTSVTVTYNGASDSQTTVTGSTPSYLSASSYSVAAGSSFTAADVTARARVAVIGQTVVSDLFGTSNPIGQTIQLGSSSFEVIGVLAAKGSSGIIDQDNVVIAPYTAVQDELTGESSSFTELLIQGRNSSTLDAVEGEVETILAAANNTTVANLPFSILNEASLLSTAESTSSTFTVLLAAVAGVSLLVGGIGVMNIMLVSVTERTREIGIRKAIGAPKSAILGQFLYESVFLSLIGGLAGVLVGVVGSQFEIDGVKPVIAPYSIFLALGVSVAVGVFFGFYPANRAASLRPIDALRYE